MTPPHVSLAMPQLKPWSAHVFGTQASRPASPPEVEDDELLVLMVPEELLAPVPEELVALAGLAVELVVPDAAVETPPEPAPDAAEIVTAIDAARVSTAGFMTLPVDSTPAASFWTRTTHPSSPLVEFALPLSGVLVQSLMRRNLVDEYVLLIHPIVLGLGRRLFIEGGMLAALRLIDTKATTTGVVIVTYQPRESTTLPGKS